MNLSSTLVETVSIDYEDFNESFLTCGTCLTCCICLTCGPCNTCGACSTCPAWQRKAFCALNTMLNTWP